MLIIFPFLPVSVNQSYRSCKNRVYKSKTLVDFEKKVDSFFKTFENVEFLSGNLKVDIVLN